MTYLYAHNADEWCDIASQSFVPLNFRRAAVQFTATLDRRQLNDQTSLSKVSSQALVIDRTPRLVSRSHSDDIHISLQVGARGVVCQHGREVPVGPGVVTLCETHQPFTLKYVEPNQRQLVLQISRAALGVDDATISALAGRQIGRASPARDAYVAFVSSLMADRSVVPEAIIGDVAGVVSSLASAMVRTERAYESVLPDHGEALLVTVVEYIGANLTSPLMNPATVAREHHISRRRLYELFEGMGATPADFIRTHRLQRAAAILAQPADLRPRISDLAYGLGFRDVTTFTRAFTREYGMTPRDYRSSYQ